MSDRIRMRNPCGCGGEEGEVRTTGGQDCVYCIKCRQWKYNAPKTETGRKIRNVQTVHSGIKPKDRARILMRATGRCELCGSSPTNLHPLHVGHLLSVEKALKLGLADDEINSDENLAAMCDACNLGTGKEVVPFRLAAAMVIARQRRILENGGCHEDYSI